MKFFKKAFTVVEMMIVVLILSVGLLGVIATLSDAYSFLYNMKNKITAVNFARGGMEGVFNIRNTNWQRRAGKKDKCWLKINPLVDEGSVGCENDTWFGSGSYIVDLTGNDQKYFYLQKMSGDPLKIDGNLVGSDWNYLLCRNNDGVVLPCHPIPSKRPDDYFDSALFFRQVRGGYLLDKRKNDPIGCDNGKSTLSDGECGDGRFLEKNFCVDVVWHDGAKRSVTFCSVLTNFKE